VQQPTDDDLARAARGERAALERLVSEYYRPVAAYLARFVGDADEAEDLAQEVFLRMARGLSGFAHKAAFTTWLFQIARNVAIDALRRREIGRAVLASSVDIRMASRSSIEDFEDAEILWSCIGALNADLRSALLLRDLLGFTYREIAEILDTTLATVKWRIFQARAQVQSRYRDASLLPEDGIGRVGRASGVQGEST
jgi:RNA polymerase sigma-70 factor (ECF subfamily)